MSRLVPHIILCLTLLLMGCGHSAPVRDDAIFIADSIEVYPDSIAIGSKSYTGAEAPYSPLISHLPIADYLTAKALESSINATPLSTWLIGALLDPDGAADSLRSRTADGKISHPRWPVTWDNLPWGAAAWQLYCINGSDSWLREAYNIILPTLRTENPISLDPSTGLFRGADPAMTTEYPSWMGRTDLLQSYSLTVNAWHQRTLSAAADMAGLLNLYAEQELRLEAKELRDKINNRFWVSPRSHYGRWLYGDLYPILSPSADNPGNTLCAIFDIATPEMASALIATRPTLPAGVPLCYPLGTAEPEFEPYVQALQALAAAKTRSADAFCAAVASLWAMGMTRDVGTEWMAVLLRGFFGLRPTPQGIAVAPFVPARFGDGSLTSSGLRYRDAILDISLRGTGDKIASFLLDGRETEPFIPAGLEGLHKVDIVLGGNILPDRKFSVLSAESALRQPVTPKVTAQADTAIAVTAPSADDTYIIWRNGVMSGTSSGAEIPVTPPAIVAVTPLSPEGAEGLSPRPLALLPEGYRLEIPATSITPRRPPLNLIKDRDTASRYIELAPRHNTRLTFWVNAPAPGRYTLYILYSNATDHTAIRTLGRVGEGRLDYLLGHLVCPPVSADDWVTTAPSTGVTIELPAGATQLSLVYRTGTVLLNNILLTRMP